MIRLFVSDLDGTLLNDAKQVDPVDRAALQELEQTGVQLCLASGRLRSEMLRVAGTVGGSFHLICQNGALVESLDGRVLSRSFFDPALALAVYDFAGQWNILAAVCLPDEDVIARRTERAADVERRFLTHYRVAPDLAQRFDADMQPGKFSLFGESDVLEALEDNLLARFPGKITAFRVAPDCLDVMPAAVTKGAGLRVLLAELGIAPAEVACVGDAHNDLAMFAVAGHSFAMRHAEPAIREGARHVAGSVAEAVARVREINRRAQGEHEGRT